MTAQQPYAGDPWDTGQPPEPRSLTRQDRVEIAARALLGYPAEHEWTESDLAPVTSISTESLVDIYVDIARSVLAVAYPQVTSAEQIEALPQGTLIVNQIGAVRWRALTGGLGLASGMTVGTVEVWEEPGAQESGRKVRRVTSATLALSGPWTVVHGSAS